MKPARDIVGIDLGTTHTVVARAAPRLFAGSQVQPLSQLVGQTEIASLDLLPSVLFAPPEGEPFADPWGEAPWVVGAHAKARGARVPRRAVTSAKSWLSHAAVDRLAPILPWGSGDEDPSLPRISPVEASRRVLAHVRKVLDQGMPDAPLHEQEIVLTVPASFDEVARELTVRAASEAGLAVRLLEEPLAAFHACIAEHGLTRLEALAREAGGEATVLVCDVGGGTTDLTLVRVTCDAGTVRLDRIAVGRHLLLGGDNMDLALAHHLEPSLAGPERRLEPFLFLELLAQCRTAKEALLASLAPPSAPIRLLARGSSLVGSTLGAELRKEDVERIVLDGFFPEVPLGEPLARGRSGLVAFGLPYEQDAAITRHVAAFLRRHSPVKLPRGILLNGGVFRSARVEERVLTVLSSWAPAPLLHLPSPDPELAVARGAVEFGRALRGHGPRIGGGSARGYYVALAPDDTTRRGICVVPRGAQEGERHAVRVPGLSLVVGQPVRFDLVASDVETHGAGALVTLDDGYTALPSMTAALDDGAGSGVLKVRLEGELTAVGTLDVACVEDEPPPGTQPRRLRLAFGLRAEPRVSIRPAQASLRPTDPRLARARELILGVFGEGHDGAEPRLARHLVRDLEKPLGERAAWTTETARTLFDLVAPSAKARKRSAEHERTFWMLAGYCLRPGYGHPLDERRLARVASLFAEVVQHDAEARTWQQFWIAWRRLAGGLGEPLQGQIRDLLDPFLSTDESKPRKRKGLRPQALDEMLELAASLERVSPARRADLGRWILERTWTSRDPRLWTALGRVGARLPTYASAHHVVQPGVVEKWLEHLLREKWNEVPTAARAASQLARLTGDRARDVGEAMRKQVARRITEAGGEPEWARAVLEVVTAAEEDRAEFFGESLPVGLVLGS